MEVFPFLPVETLRIGLLRAGLGNRSFLPARQLCGGSRRSRLRDRGAGGGRGRSDATGTRADDGGRHGDDR